MSSGDHEQRTSTDAARSSSFFSDEAAAVMWGHHRDLLIVVALLCLTTLTAGCFYPRFVRSDGVTDAASGRALATGVDPNTAQWYEIAQLPGIGETAARRWVAHRQQHGGNRPAFARPHDLTRIRGIGERTLRRIAPFLRFPDHPTQ
jgi:competence protein ComEA